MPVFSCANCGFRFEASESKKCPRCTSTEVSSFGKEENKGAEEKHSGAKSFGGPLKTGKEGWKDFHSSDLTACPDCGSKEFERNWKRKEKTCSKCGAIMPLPRRMA